MLFGGNSGSCGGCGCKSCQECTRTCTNPHTGTAFETVYTLYFEGVEAGNPSDGYLDATGDVDTSDPYDGMDGTGPWSQTVSGTFSLTKATTRYPCYVRVSFWRSNFVLGANTIPPPATTLTAERITVTNSPVSEGAIFADNVLLQPGESHQFDNTIQLVAGAGDQSTNDKRFYNGMVSVRAACANDFVSFTVSGHIAWNVKKRQHILYGTVRECYETGTPCSTFCNGSPAPDVLYLTISNYTGPTYDAGTPMDIEGTYVLDRIPGICNSYAAPWTYGLCFSSQFPLAAAVFGVVQVNRWGAESFGIYMGHFAPVNGFCGGFELFTPETEFTVCGSGVIHSGTNGRVRIGTVLGSGTVHNNKFDWEIST